MKVSELKSKSPQELQQELNSLLKAETMTGNGRTVQALDIDKLREILKKHGR
mgnify:CR=1 FL=1